MGPANSDGTPRVPPYSGYHPGRPPPSPTGLSPPLAQRSRLLRLGLSAPRGGPMTPRGPQPARFGLCPVRSPLLGASRLFSPPLATKMFQFTRFASRLAPGCLAFSQTGCPIRTPPGHRLCAPRRGFSQLVASFIASESQGILHAPCLTSCALAACVSTPGRPRDSARPPNSPPRGGHPEDGCSCSRFLYRVDLWPLASRRAPNAVKDLAVENIGLEPMASCLQSRRSTS